VFKKEKNKSRKTATKARQSKFEFLPFWKILKFSKIKPNSKIENLEKCVYKKEKNKSRKTAKKCRKTKLFFGKSFLKIKKIENLEK